MSGCVTDLAKLVLSVNEGRLDGRMTRAAHAVTIAEIDKALTAAGHTWADIEAAIKEIG